MFPALGTLIAFAIAPVLARRALLRVGPLPANLWRLLIAAVLLGIWAHGVGSGLGGPALGWFLGGGVLGFGLGGVTMFLALHRIGSNLSTLIVQCGSAVVAALAEWCWLGTSLGESKIAYALLIFAGLAWALLPRAWPRISRADWLLGITWAVLSAIGQGLGAVLSRKAFAVCASSQFHMDPGTATYQRVLGGVLVGALALLLLPALRSRPAEPGGIASAWPWILLNSLCGPVLGVACYQWALQAWPAGRVLSVVSAAPLVTIPLAAWLEGVRPRRSYYAAACLAVVGVAGLLLSP